MLKETTDELFGGEGGKSGRRGGRVFVFEGDAVVFDVEDAVVANGNTKDVRREIFEGNLAATDRLTVNHPGFGPYSGMDYGKQLSLLQEVTQLCAEDDR